MSLQKEITNITSNRWQKNESKQRKNSHPSLGFYDLIQVKQTFLSMCCRTRFSTEMSRLTSMLDVDCVWKQTHECFKQFKQAEMWSWTWRYVVWSVCRQNLCWKNWSRGNVITQFTLSNGRWYNGCCPADTVKRREQLSIEAPGAPSISFINTVST